MQDSLALGGGFRLSAPLWLPVSLAVYT